YFKERCADPIAVADAHFVVGQSLNRKILAELSERKILVAQLAFPVFVGIDLIDQTAGCSQPCPAGSPWASPWTFSRRTKRLFWTGSFHTFMCTVSPRHEMSQSELFLDVRFTVIGAVSSGHSRVDCRARRSARVDVHCGSGRYVRFCQCHRSLGW